VLVDAEELGSFVQRSGVGADDPLHTGSGLSPEFEIRRLNRAHGGDQVGNLFLCTTNTTPLVDVFIRRGLHAVLDLADAGEVLTSLGCQDPPRETRLLAKLPETGSQRLLRLLGGTKPRSTDRG